jgi:hypothetical protein
MYGNNGGDELFVNDIYALTRISHSIQGSTSECNVVIKSTTCQCRPYDNTFYIVNCMYIRIVYLNIYVYILHTTPCVLQIMYVCFIMTLYIP